MRYSAAAAAAADVVVVDIVDVSDWPWLGLAWPVGCSGLILLPLFIRVVDWRTLASARSRPELLLMARIRKIVFRDSIYS